MPFGTLQSKSLMVCLTLTEWQMEGDTLLKDAQKHNRSVIFLKVCLLY